MTAVCGGGASQEKPGVGIAITVGSDAVAAVMDVLGLELPAILVSAIAAGIQLVSNIFCGGDPPEDPHPTQTDLNNALQFDQPSVSFPAIAKYQQWFLSNYWYQICECVSVSTPAAPSLSNPGSSSDSPGLPGGQNSACFSNTYNDTQTVPAAGVVVHDLTPSLLPVAGPAVTITNGVVGGFANVTMQVWPIPTSVTSATIGAITADWDSSIAAGGHAVANFSTATVSGWSGGIELWQGGAPTVPPTTFHPNQPSIWPTGATHWAVTSIIGFTTGDAGKHETGAYTASGMCNGPPLQQACCPPDPLIDQKLTQIIGYLTYLINNPAQQPASSWSDGPRHNNLGEAGSIALSKGTVGVRAEIVTLPPNVTTNPGDPNFYWDLGFITPLALDVPLRGARLVFNPQSFQLPNVADGVAYTLLHGTVINLVELQPVTA